MFYVDSCVAFFLFGEPNAAMRRLRRNQSTLFNCLQVTVSKLGAWQETDVTANLNGGSLTTDIDALPPAFKGIHDALTRQRVYGVCNLTCWSRDSPEADAGSFQDDVTESQDFENALLYERQFDRIFTAGPAKLQTVISNREFAAFYHLLRCFDEDVSTVADNTPSSLKASNFTVHVVQSPSSPGSTSILAVSNINSRY